MENSVTAGISASVSNPVHRRTPMVRTPNGQLHRWAYWLMPAMLFVQAIFMGSAFGTAAALFAFWAVATLWVTLVVQWRPDDASASLQKQNTQQPQGAFVKMRQRQNASPKDVSRGNNRLRIGLMWPAVACGCVVAAAWRIGFHSTGITNPVALLVDTVAHMAYCTAFLMWVFHPRRGHPFMLGCGLVVVLMTVTAGGVSHSINGQLAAAFVTVIAFCAAADHILPQWQGSRWRARRNKLFGKHETEPTFRIAMPYRELPAASISTSQERSRGAWPISVLALSALLMSCSVVGHMAFSALPGLQLELFDRLSKSLESVTSNSIIGGSRYVSGSKLGAIRTHMLGDPTQPAIYAYADMAPGYLRGTVFDSYRSGSWSSEKARDYGSMAGAESLSPRLVASGTMGTVNLRGYSSIPLRRVQLRETEAGSDVVTVEVHNVKSKGQRIFAALGTDWIECDTSGIWNRGADGGISVSHQDVVRHGVNSLEPYVLGVSEKTPRDQLTPLRQSIMLRVPIEIRPAIARIARKACADSLTARSKAKAIEDFFQDNYTYSMQDLPSHGDADPLVFFLESQHSAHCEYFASAAALMLRCVGVPTRYVTGYVVAEANELDESRDDYWLARNRDAHAWVEAYDKISERWFPVEATVGRTYRTVNAQNELLSLAEGSAADLLGEEEEQSLFNWVLGQLLSIRTSESLTFIFRVAQLPLFCLVLGLLWYRRRNKLRENNDPGEYKSRQMLQHVDKRVRKLSLVRDSNETLHQFAMRLETVANKADERQQLGVAKFLMVAADWYRSFAADRYRGRQPTAMDENTVSF